MHGLPLLPGVLSELLPGIHAMLSYYEYNGIHGLCEFSLLDIHGLFLLPSVGSSFSLDLPFMLLLPQLLLALGSNDSPQVCHSPE